MSTLRSKFILSCLAALALCAALVPAPAAADAILCRCAQQSLETLTCSNDLAAKIKVIASAKDNDATYYLADVKKVFRGEETKGNLIVLKAQSGCSFDLRKGKTYAVSLNLDIETGYYSTFACSSFVSEWNQLEDADIETLEAPQCSACDPACEDGQTCIMQEVVCVRAPCNPVPACVPNEASQGEVCYRFFETDPAMSVDRSCAEGLKCVDTSGTFGFNSTRTCQPENWCLNDSTAANDCDGLIHPMVVGQWGCTAEHTCAWRASEPRN